jgi:hypothetical protein
MPRYEYALIPAGYDGPLKTMSLSSEPLRGITIDINFEELFRDRPSIPASVLVGILTPNLQLVMIDRGSNETDEADG